MSDILDSLSPLSNKARPMQVHSSGVLSEGKYDGLNLLDTFSQGISEESFVGLLQTPYETEDGVDFVPDESSDEDKEKWIEENHPILRKEYRKKLIDSSGSIEELAYHMPTALEKSRIRSYTDEMGFSGMAVEMASVLPDILAITGISLVSPVAAAPLAATRLRAFTVGAVTEGAFQVLQDNYGQRERSTLEMMVSPVFSGALNSLLTRGVSEKLGIHQEIMKYNIQRGMGITDEVEEALKKATTKEEKDSIYKEAIDKHLKETDDEKTILSSGTGEEVSGLVAKRQRELDADLEAGRLSKNAHAKLRFDNEMLGKTSPSKTMREISGSLFPDGTLQHNRAGEYTMTEAQDLYESISARKTRDLYAPLERKLSDLKEKSITDRFAPKFLDNSNVGVSNIAGYMQGIRDLKIGDDTYAFNMGTRRLVNEFGLNEDDAKKLAAEIMDANKKQSLHNGEINTRFKDENFVGENARLTPRDDYFTNVFTFHGNSKLADRGIELNEIKEFWFQGLKSHWKKSVSKKDGSLTSANVWTKEKEAQFREAATKLTEMLGNSHVYQFENKNSKNIFMKAFEDSGMNKAEIDEFMSRVERKTGSSYMKTRMPFDRSFVLNSKNGEISLLDFISTDMNAVQARYMKSNAGRIAGQQYKFKVPISETEHTVQSLGTTEGAEYLMAKVNKELNDLASKGKLTDGQVTSEMARLKHWIDHLHGNPTAVDASSPLHKIFQITSNLNSWRLLGKVPLAMTAELSNVIGYTGVKNYAKNAPLLKKMLGYFNKGKVDDEVWKEAGDVLGLGSEYVQGLRSMVNDHDFDSEIYNSRKSWIDKALNKGIEVSEKLAEFTLMTGGMKPYVAYLQYSMYTGLSKVIREMSEGNVSNFHKQIFKEMGISEDVALRIQNQMKKYGKGKKESVFDFNKWDDDEASLSFSFGMKRLIDNVVQKPTLGAKMGVTIGDKVLASTPMGKSFLELKQYMYQSYVKQTGKMIESKSVYHYMMLMSQIGLLSAMYPAEQYALHSSNPSKLEDKLTMESMISTVAGRVTVAGYPSMVLGATSRAALGENYFSIARDTNAGIAQAVLQQMPLIDLLNTMGGIIPNIAKATYEEDNNLDGLAKTFKKSTSNIIPMTIMNNYIENSLKPDSIPFK